MLLHCEPFLSVASSSTTNSWPEQNSLVREAVRTSIEGVHGEVRGIRASTEQLPHTTQRMADSFDRSNDELEALRHEMRPMIQKVNET